MGNKQRKTNILGKCWQLQDAKAKFSELLRRVRLEGPQRITRQGKDAVVVLPAEQFDDLVKQRTGGQSLVDFFSKSPMAGIHFTLKRKPDFGRAIDL